LHDAAEGGDDRAVGIDLDAVTGAEHHFAVVEDADPVQAALRPYAHGADVVARDVRQGRIDDPDPRVGVVHDRVVRDGGHRHLADRYAAQTAAGDGVALDHRVRVVQDDPLARRTDDDIAGDHRWRSAPRVRELDAHPVGTRSGAALVP